MERSRFKNRSSMGGMDCMCSLRATAVIHKLNQKTKSLVSISLRVVWSFKMGSSCIYVYH